MERKIRLNILMGSCLAFFVQTSYICPAFSQMPSEPSDTYRIERPTVIQNDSHAQATALLKAGIERHQKGDDDGAMLLFHQAIVLDPSNSDAHFDFAAIEEARGQIGAAIANYQAVLENNPNDQTAIAAINQLQVAVHAPSNFQNTPVLKGVAHETSLLPSANAFAPPQLMSETPGAAVTTNKFKQPKPPKSKGGTMRALKTIGSIALKTAVAASQSGLMYYGRAGVGVPTGTVDTCACNTLGN